MCGRIWSLACTVLLTTIRNGPQFFLFLFIYWQKTRNCPQFFSGGADIASMAKPLKPHAFTFIKLSRFLIQCLLISDNFWPTVIIKVFCLKKRRIFVYWKSPRCVKLSRSGERIIACKCFNLQPLKKKKRRKNEMKNKNVKSEKFWQGILSQHFVYSSS